MTEGETPKQIPVSVVIPARNAERFIREALDSLAWQTTQPTEVIVVDDGSTDRTSAISRSMDAHVIHQSGKGPSAARNVAIRAASQPWIAFLDADDVWEPDKLRHQWLAARTCPDAGAIFTDFVEFDHTGATGPSFLSRIPHYREIAKTELLPAIVRYHASSLHAAFHRGNFLLPSTALVKRDLLLQVGLFDTAITHMEDRELWLRTMAVADVLMVERALVRARVHDANASSNDLRMALGAIQVADRVLSDPGKYPRGSEAVYRTQLPAFHLNAGRVAEAQGDLRLARMHYHRSWRLGGGVRPFTLSILSRFPRLVRTTARTLVRRINGRPEARVSET